MAKKATKRKTTKKNTKSEQHARKQMWAIVMFALGILLFLLAIIKGTKLWLGLHNLLFGLLGWSSYFLGPLCIYLAVLATQDKPLEVIQRKIWQSSILMLLLCGTINVFRGLPPVKGAAQIIQRTFKDGVAGQGGGVLGLITAGPLSLFGSAPIPQIIMLLALFVFVMLVTGSTLMTLYYMIKKPVKGIENAYSQRMEIRKAQEQEEQLPLETKFVTPHEEEESPEARVPEFYFDKNKPAKPKFDIDVDISGDKAPEEFSEAEPPLEPITKDLAGVSLNDPMPEEEESEEEEDPFASFGVDSPVERVGGRRQPSAQRIFDVYKATRPHPLEEEIHEAKEEEDDVLGAVEEYLSQIKTNDDEEEFVPVSAPLEDWEQETFSALPELPSEPETFRVDVTQPRDTVRFGNGEDWGSPFRVGLTPSPLVVEEEPLPEENDWTSLVEPHHHPLSEEAIAPEPEPLSEPTPPAKQEEKSFVETVQNSLQEDVSHYQLPPISLLKKVAPQKQGNIKEELQENAEKLVATLENFGVKTKIIDVARGPAVTRYELQPAPGVKISRITGLADDIALNLAAAGIRIEAPIPNKPAVGIEVPNKNVSVVSIREIIDTEKFRTSDAKVAMALGKDITGNIAIADIAKMPHMLIAGATGSGKSVCINSIVMSILYKYTPDQVKLLMIDPKVVELGVYNGIPHLLVPVVTEPKKAAGALSWAVTEMLKRYQLFAENGVRDITGFNRYVEKHPQQENLEAMPQVVIIIDELADLMMAAPNEVEDSICRLAQMARAAGMHLIIATQRPSVDVITGVIKANIPSRIAFAVSSQVDSRTILDMGGAEKLLGRGDMLFYPVGAAKPVRIQGCFVTDQEVESVVDFIKSSGAPRYDEEVAEEIERLTEAETEGNNPGGGFDDEDEMIPYAIECVVEAGQASTSMLQRRLKLGYARAGRIIDQLEARGIVGPFEGSKPRQLLISKDQYLEMKLAGLDQPNSGQTRLED